MGVGFLTWCVDFWQRFFSSSRARPLANGLGGRFLVPGSCNATARVHFTAFRRNLQLCLKVKMLALRQCLPNAMNAKTKRKRRKKECKMQNKERGARANANALKIIDNTSTTEES
jgi:hypothetical protein